MKFFVVYELRSLNKVLSSGMINLNGKYIFKKQPKISNDQVILKFDVNNHEIREITKVSDDRYILIGSINLEGRKLDLVCYDEIQKDEILKLGKIYKELKDVYSNNISYSIYDNHGINYIKYSYPINEILNKFYSKQTEKMNKIKGFLYGFLYDNSIYTDYVIKQKSGLYDEIIKITDLIENLRKKKYLDRNLYYSAINFKSNLEKKLLENINSLKNKNLIFGFDARKGIKINKELFSLSDDEGYLLCIILNILIKNVNNKNDAIINLIDGLKTVINNKDSLKQFHNDLLLIEKRVKNYEYSININEIKNIVFKNLYTFCIKYNNFKELNGFILEKRIEKSYIANCIYGAFHGYDKLSNIVAKNNDSNEIIISIVEKAIRDIENNFNSIKFNYYYYRDNLLYNINRLLQSYENLAINEKCEILRTNEQLEVIIKNTSEEKMIIRMYKREKNISKNIIYYDNKIKRIKNIYPNSFINNEYYFDYRFKQGNIAQPRNYKLEYEFALIIEDLLNTI